MEDDNNTPIIVLSMIAGFIIALLLFVCLTPTEVKEIGQMVCDEKGHGEFVEFDSENKIIECESKPKLQKYDGGYIKVVE